MLRQGLYRSKTDRMIAGVCGGLAKRFSTNATWLRMAFVLFTFLGGAGFLLYLFLWVIMPEENLST